MHVIPLQQRYWVDKIFIGNKKGVYEPKKKKPHMSESKKEKKDCT